MKLTITILLFGLCLTDFIRAEIPLSIRRRPPPPTDEDSTQTCRKKFEVFKECGSGCGETTCETLKNPPRICPAVCRRGCFCQPGYVRSSGGNCIRKENCPEKPKDDKVCKANEEFCCKCQDKNCENLDSNVVCKRCIDGCYCKDGFARNENGKCVPEKQCKGKPVPIKCKKPNQEYSECGAHGCQNTCAKPTFSHVCRPAGCMPGCICKEGYLKNEKGECVEPSNCESTSEQCKGKNESYQECGNRCAEKTCRDLNGGPMRACAYICQSGCYCSSGFVRNDKGVCVKESQCPKTKVCKANEEFGCGCADKTCKNPKLQIMCIRCEDKCFCKEGFLRDSNNRCVAANECPKPEPVTCKKKNEEYSECGANGCQNTCANPTLGQVCKAACIAGCVCKEGFIKNDKNECVKPESCDPACPANEVFTRCGKSCDRNCGDPVNKRCPKDCRKGCVCDKGFSRDQSGNCVPDNQCPKPIRCNKADNEVFNQCVAPMMCQLSCATLDNPIMCKAMCRPGCKCMDGYVRNDKDKCIKKSQCPKPKVCKANEEHGCRCADQTCEDPNHQISCDQCENKCFCKPGFLRASNGQCVHAKQCPKPQTKCEKPNQQFSKCGAHGCQNTCDSPKRSRTCRARCTPGCVCKPGFIKNKKGECVEPNQCPQENVCPRFEEFSQCGKRCEKLCGDPIDKPCNEICAKGCICIKGYSRNKNGQCVPEEKCPKPTQKCNKPNQVYSDCGAHGCQNTCENPTLSQVCDPIGCVAGCICKKGYLKNDKGDCVKLSQCSQDQEVCPKFEKFSRCGKRCEKLCGDLPNKPCVKICARGCICIDGYSRNTNGQCIRDEKCPKPTEKCKKPNQVYSECGAHGCQNTCANPTFSHVCRPAGCMPGCICRNGYLKNDNGECVKPSQCPSTPTPECPENEVYAKCGASTCQRRCMDDIFPRPCAPPRDCRGGCVCAQGYVRDDQGSSCVPKSSCPKKPKCGKNEMISMCSMPIICQKGCSRPNVACKAPCKLGCVCQNGFVRDDEGNCIPENKCPNKCKNAHEVYSECGSRCGELTCKNKDDNERACPAVCDEGCFCEKGYVRNENGKCIKADQCPKEEVCPKNEEFSQCGKRCEKLCGDPEFKPCPKICLRGCICSKGYARNSKGVCVLIEKCPKPSCKGPHEEYTACNAFCQATCQYPDLPKYCKPAGCTPGCICKEGYIKNDDDKCIKNDKCPNIKKDENTSKPDGDGDNTSKPKNDDNTSKPGNDDDSSTLKNDDENASKPGNDKDSSAPKNDDDNASKPDDGDKASGEDSGEEECDEDDEEKDETKPAKPTDSEASPPDSEPASAPSAAPLVSTQILSSQILSTNL